MKLTFDVPDRTLGFNIVINWINEQKGSLVMSSLQCSGDEVTEECYMLPVNGTRDEDKEA